MQESWHFVRSLRHLPIGKVSEMLTLVLLTATVFIFLHTSQLSAQLESARARHQLHSVSLSLGEKIENNSLLSSKVGIMNGSGGSRSPQPPPDTGLYTTYNFGELNVTKYAGNDVIFFNRVPKVGSQSTMLLLWKLSLRNKFDFHRDRVRKDEQITLKPAEEVQLCALINNFRPAAVYTKHVNFLDFPRYNFTPPIYFNMVRDPVERIISWYYYIRAPWYFVERKMMFTELEMPDPGRLRKDYETCVLTNDWECQYIAGVKGDLVGDHRNMIGFFCGMGEECSAFNSEVALQRAKRNVEKYYAVVGVLEQMNKTLAVLEHYIPRFFGGATELYNNGTDFSKNRNIYKPPVADYVKDIVRKNFTHEIEFYEFCKQRLHQQYLALNLKDGS